jgi:HPt (histidine-containing phosphotransfer) domain-containing protein
VEGVDVRLGLRRFGGREDHYLKALALFAKSLGEMMEDFTLGPGGDLTGLKRRLSAVKSAAANIGAEAVSKEAQFLEEAASSSDTFAVRVRFETFRRSLQRLVEGVSSALDRFGIFPLAPLKERTRTRPLGIPEAELAELGERLSSRDIGGVDRILDRLQKGENDPETSRALQRLSEHVLMADYDEASRLVADELSLRAGGG